jgi:hypothetical protein
VKPYVEEQLADRPGVYRIRPVQVAEQGRVDAERTRNALCSACLKRIGDELFVRIDGAPKHYRHVLGR